MIKPLVLALVLVQSVGGLQARPKHLARPRRASVQAVIAFMRKDLVALPTSTRFERVHWNPMTQEWEVTLEPPYTFDVWTVNAAATDYSHMCFF